MKVNHQSQVPLHRQIEDQIRQLVKAGKYDKGELLPKEMELAAKLGVARNTVRQAINKLVIEGVLLRKKGVGTMLAPKTIPTSLQKWLSFSGEMHAQGVPMRPLLLRTSEEIADETISQALGVRKGQKLVKLEKLMGSGKTPLVYFISWFHPRTGLRREEDFSKPLYQLLEKEHGILARRSSEELQAVGCDRLLTYFLKTREGEPLLLRRRTVFDEQDRIIEYNLGYYRGNKFSYRLDVNREGEE